MIEWPLPVGTVVRGADCIGRKFEAKIIGYRGSLTPVLSDGFITPASLIREVVKTTPVFAETGCAADDGFLPNDPVPASCPHWPGCGCGTQSGPHACERTGTKAEPAPVPGAQLSLF